MTIQLTTEDSPQQKHPLGIDGITWTPRREYVNELRPRMSPQV
jgi:hypothetical protein